jgi:CBS domain-containing protein
MRIGDICTRTVVVAGREASVYEGAALMRQHHTGDVVVIDAFEGRRIPVGMVTDRDIVIEVLAQNIDPDGLTLGELMTPSIVTAHEQDGVFESIQLMRAEGIRRLPVVDRCGSLVGIVSLGDLLETIAEEMTGVVNLPREARRKEVVARR